MEDVRHLAFITIILIVTVVGLGGVAAAQSPTVPEDDCRYFPKTGHYVCGEFLDFFETRGGLEIFGYPLSEAFNDPTHRDLRVQYFQRARMEEHPSNPPPYQVQLGLLVDELGYVYPPVAPEERPSPGDPAHRYFPETQHVVSHAFLTFFREHGGLDIFGYPRSEMLFQDDLVVQYFQRARMAWHRDRPRGRQITLANVGEWYIERFGVPKNADRRQPPPSQIEWPWTRRFRRRHRLFLPLVLLTRSSAVPAQPAQPAPTEPPTTASPTTVPPTAAPTGTPAPPPATAAPRGAVTALDVSASVRYPITGRTGTQTTYVYVNDQQGRPVAGAEATVVVHYPSGDLTCIAGPTDAAGFARCSFDIPSPPVGKEVLIDVTVTYDGLRATTQTFFMPWW
jgi:hypothetical protein